MTERDLFYAERDRRTRECGVPDIFDMPVGVVVGEDAAASPDGQLALLALVNMLARVHRHLSLHVPPVALVRPALVPAQRLDEAACLLARTIDPYIRLDHTPSGPHALGIGAGAPFSAPWYAGFQGQVAVIDRGPVPFETYGRLSLGAGLASCLAAGNLLRQVLGLEVRPARVSAWDLGEGERAGRGPDLAGPLDVGDVLQVGAGGVGSCLAYWLREFGVLGHWRVIDRDSVQLHNTNRSLGLFPRDAGWPRGSARNKAVAAAELFGGQPEPVWYDEFDQNSFAPDLVLPLANERSVRRYVACRGEPVVLHATTSRTWEAQLHRHIPGLDDCITCRMPEHESRVQLSCATVRLEGTGTPSTDAALPFLSATAGLLLLSGLFRLQHGELAEGRHNLWAVCFRDERRQARQAVHRCHEGCAATLPGPARLAVHKGRRWSHVDPAAHSPPRTP